MTHVIGASILGLGDRVPVRYCQLDLSFTGRYYVEWGEYDLSTSSAMSDRPYHAVNNQRLSQLDVRRTQGTHYDVAMSR